MPFGPEPEPVVYDLNSLRNLLLFFFLSILRIYILIFNMLISTEASYMLR